MSVLENTEDAAEMESVTRERDELRERALRAEAEVAAIKTAVATLNRGPCGNEEWRGLTAALNSGLGSDLLDAVRKAREALEDFPGTCCDGDGDEAFPAHEEKCHVGRAIAALSRFLPEGT